MADGKEGVTALVTHPKFWMTEIRGYAELQTWHSSDDRREVRFLLVMPKRHTSRELLIKHLLVRVYRLDHRPAALKITGFDPDPGNDGYRITAELPTSGAVSDMTFGVYLVSAGEMVRTLSIVTTEAEEVFPPAEEPILFRPRRPA